VAAYPLVIEVRDQSQPHLYPSSVTTILPASIVVNQPS
jgi:hypothetical protein